MHFLVSVNKFRIMALWKRLILTLILVTMLNLSPQIIYFPSRIKVRSKEIFSLENDEITTELICVNEQKKFAELVSISLLLTLKTESAMVSNFSSASS